MELHIEKKHKQLITTTGSLKNYIFIKKISKGTFGEVNLYQKHNKNYAIKKFIAKKIGPVHITTIRELKSLIELNNCDYIIQINEIIFENKNIYVVFPYYETTLAKIKYQYVHDIQNHFKQCISGIKYIHDKNIIHRDLKSTNILIDLNNKIKIIDFGMSRKLNPLMTSIVTTLWYRAPELLEHGEKNLYVKYEKKIDVWSMGIILLEMFLGFVPCQSNNEIQQYTKIKETLSNIHEKYYFLPENVKNLLAKMLEFNPEKRISINEIVLDPFLTEKINEKETICIPKNLNI